MIYGAPDNGAGGSGGRTEGAGTAGSTWSVGPWRVDAGTGELRRGTESLRVEPKVAEVLLYLARRSGQVVSREELLTAVWPGVLVGDDALTQAIIKLRKALGDDAKRPTYIETLAKRGYRLIAPVGRVTEVGVKPALSPVSPGVAAPPPRDAVAPLVKRTVEAAASPPPVSMAAEAVASRLSYVRLLGAAARFGGETWKRVTLGGGLVALALVVGLALGIQRYWARPISIANTPRSVASTLPVIAVLPLRNQSGDPAREFFSDGVTEDIIHALGRYSGLRVISRNSVQQFKQREATHKVVSSELGARYVVTGSVRETDGQVRVAVELSDAETARVLWSERFDRKGGEVFEIQDSIVQSVVAALAVKVSKLEGDRAATRSPSLREAYDLVLLARSLELKAERAANRQGRELIAKALALAPEYAMAYIVESTLEEQRADLGWMENPEQGLILSERAARRALTIDDPGTNARAHAMLARNYMLRGNQQLALAESERATALNPSDPFIAEIHAQSLLWQGRSHEAVTLMENAIRLDPAGRRSPVRQVILIAYFTAERYDEGLVACDRGLADFPDLPMLHAMRAAILVQKGRVEEARQSAATLQRLRPNFPIREIGSRFVAPANSERLQSALRKAGL
ncbi:MAG: winged helix-turn-helix domain-containing protein [Xanthobacteraceae bacterium]|nr:winged helix-turn-helix domain-containing protein [Xanthobacteraceae bacterium]